MNAVLFPLKKLISLCAAFSLLTPLSPVNHPPNGSTLFGRSTSLILETEALKPGLYSPDNPGFVYSGSDWTVQNGSAETKVQHAIVMWQVTLNTPGVIIMKYDPAPDAGEFQVQFDSDPLDEPVNQAAGEMGTAQYWVSRTLKAGEHKIYLTSLDEKPVNFSAVAIGPIVEPRDAVYDNAEPGAIVFGKWTEMNFVMAANGGKAAISGADSGPIFVVFEQQFPGSLNVNMISTEESGRVHVVLDGLPTDFPYQTPGEPIAVSIIIGKTEAGRHVLMITGDDSKNVVRFDGYKISEKRPANMPTLDPKKDPNSKEYTPVITVEHHLPALSAGKYHACFVDIKGGVQCRGYNASGQLGRGSEGSSLDILPIGPVDGLDSGVEAIVTGGYHTCALLTGGIIKCWGSNQYGQLGNGASKSVQNEPVYVVDLAGEPVDITAGEYHTCALLSNGKVQCWGLNGAGQLGNGITQEFLGRKKPVDVIGLPTAATQILAGANHTCARLMDGSLWCWGNDEYGQLGDGTIVKDAANKGKPVPVKVTGLENASLLAAGSHHTCALADKKVYCWGDNTNGQLGTGTMESSSVPQPVIGLYDGVYALASGEKHTCALSPDQSETIKGIQCWGDNQYGQLGNGSTVKNSPSPVDVTGYTGEKISITAGYEYTCILSKDDKPYCWGMSSYGQSDNMTDSPLPTGQEEINPGITPIPGLPGENPGSTPAATPTAPSPVDNQTH
jgi:alpha-tubulin suppressor-like RCC1 family protein